MRTRRSRASSESANRDISLETFLRWSPAVFLVHDLEEILTMEQFWLANRDRIPIPEFIKDRIAVNTGQMEAAVAFVFAASCYTSYLATRSPKTKARVGLFNVMVSVRLLNGLFHLSQTLAIRGYTPGVATALLVSLPYSVYILHRLRAEELVTTRDLYRSIGLGVLLHTPLVLGAQTLGRMLVRLLTRDG